MSVGETLRKAREAKGLSIEDVKNSTQIMARQLQEMEEDDFSSFADPFYAKFFVRSFARAVGLDPAPVVQAFIEQTSGGSPARPKATAKTVAVPASAPAPVPGPAPAPAPAAEAAPAAAEAAAQEEDLFSRAAASAPGSGGEPPKAPAPAKTAAKVAVSTPLEFERRPAPQPQPEKRVAAPAPGDPAPVAPLFRADSRPAGRAEFVPPPAAKKLPEPPSAAFHGASPSGRPVAPDPLPLDGPAFRFPETPPPPPGEAAPAPSAPRTAPSAPVVSPLQPRLRKSFAAPVEAAPPDEEIVAAKSRSEKPSTPPEEDDEEIVAAKAPRKRREPRPDAPNAASLFFSNLAASARRAFSGKKGARIPLLAGAAALVALCVAGGVYLAAGGGEGVSVPPEGALSGPETADSAAPPEPLEDVAPVFPPPASWAK